MNRHDLVRGFRQLGFDEIKNEEEEDTSMEPGSVWMHLLGEIETNGRGNLSFLTNDSGVAECVEAWMDTSRAVIQHQSAWKMLASLIS